MTSWLLWTFCKPEWEKCQCTWKCSERTSVFSQFIRSLKQNQPLNPWTQSLCLSSALSSKRVITQYKIVATSQSPRAINVFSLSWLTLAWEELCEDRQYDRTENRTVLLCHRAHMSSCSPSRWNFMEVLAPGNKSQCFSPGRKTSWLSLGIQNTRQEMPRSARRVRVRGLHLTPVAWEGWNFSCPPCRA